MLEVGDALGHHRQLGIAEPDHGGRQRGLRRLRRLSARSHRLGLLGELLKLVGARHAVGRQRHQVIVPGVSNSQRPVARRGSEIVESGNSEKVTSREARSARSISKLCSSAAIEAW